MTRQLAICLILLLLWIPSKPLAKTYTIYASYKYIMGDNDTKNDAKRLCFIGAKRRLLEKAGTFITSETEVRELNLKKDEIKSYSAAVLNVEIVEERVESKGESLVIIINVKADVDTTEVRNNLKKIRDDVLLQKKIKERTKKIWKLEQRISDLQKQLATKDYKESIELRTERKDAFENLEVENEKIRKILVLKMKRDIDRTELIRKNAMKVRAILKYVEIGLTPNEVKEIIGEITGKYDFHEIEYEYIIFKNYSKDLGQTFYGIFETSYLRRLYFVFEWDNVLHELLLAEIQYLPHGKKVLEAKHTLKDKTRDLFDDILKSRYTLKDKKYNILNEKDLKKMPPLLRPEIHTYIWGD